MLDWYEKGHRLGTADEAAHLAGPVSNTMDRQDELPDPVYNPNLTDDERARIRADRAAAAEARLKKQAGGQKPKKKTSNSAPLVGPNSQPTMRWTSG